ncbi:MAG: [Fe-Fe] hydrogenase large subunit C-terminal domain-containing protein [Oscillospiraceae bacterium]
MSENYIEFNQENCQNCYKCIRACPVKSIAFKDNHASIVESECIQCGHCFLVCPQNAKVIRSDYQKVRQLIEEGKTVIASIAPSFVANYKGANITSMKAALKLLGFADVQETALGATVVKTEYERLIKENPQGVIISSCCHTLNSLVEKYYPQALPYLAKVITPMQAHCRMIKEQNPTAYTVFIGPCISKKAEIEQYAGDVDYALTFIELSQWLKGAKVEIPVNEQEQDIGRARLFPTAGGIIRSMTKQSGVHYVAIDGSDNCINALKDIIEGNLKNCFVEMSFCTGSCIGGPAMEQENKRPVRDVMLINEYAGKEDFPVKRPMSTNKNHTFLGGGKKRPGAADIDRILAQMGKTEVKKQLNCGCCGYNSCYEKAIAVYQGKAQITMCLPYLIEKSQSFSDNVIEHTPNGIIVMDEQLNIQQINKAACEIVNLPLAKAIIGLPVDRILDPEICYEAMDTQEVIKDRLSYLSDYKKYVEQTVFYDREYKVIAVILRDVSEGQTAKERKNQINSKAAQITNNVIEKQMRVVQEIASLLGETVAETQIALSKMEETLNNE